ncbi:MAG: ATP-binding protein, partial [Verrucomicrobiota bacterium]
VTFSHESETKETALDLDRFVAEVVFVLRRSFDRRIKVEHFEDSSPTWLVHADANLMMQVLLALCLNARNSMPNGGELSIRVAKAQFSSTESVPPRKSGDFVRLTIGDTGEGIPPELISRLFEPSFAGSDFEKRVGFGLSIAQSMIVAFGGWIEVESISGHGTKFDIYLPRLLQEDVHSGGTVTAVPGCAGVSRS